jgi:hypothetical protein
MCSATGEAMRMIHGPLTVTAASPLWNIESDGISSSRRVADDR